MFHDIDMRASDITLVDDKQQAGKPEKEQWSRWQRRRPDVETVSVYGVIVENVH